MFAIASNVLFIGYGLLGDIYPAFLLHVALLPINLIKLHRLSTDRNSARRPESLRLIDFLDDSGGWIEYDARHDNPDQAKVVSLLRLVLDDVLSDRRFAFQNAISAIELAEHIVAQAAQDERDVARLKQAAFKKLGF